MQRGYPSPIGRGYRSSYGRRAPVAAAATPPSQRGSSTNGITGTITLPSHQIGDVLVVFLATDSSANNINVAGWTIQQNDSNIQRGYIFSKIAASAAETFSVGAFSSSTHTWFAFAFMNAIGVDTSASSHPNSATPPCPSVTPTVAPTLLIDAVISNTEDGATTITMPTGETATGLINNGTKGTMMKCGSKALVAVGATGTRAATLNAISANTLLTAVVK